MKLKTVELTVAHGYGFDLSTERLRKLEGKLNVLDAASSDRYVIIANEIDAKSAVGLNGDELLVRIFVDDPEEFTNAALAVRNIPWRNDAFMPRMFFQHIGLIRGFTQFGVRSD